MSERTYVNMKPMHSLNSNLTDKHHGSGICVEDRIRHGQGTNVSLSLISLRENSHLEDSEWDRLGKFFRTEGTSKEKAPGNWNINKPYADRNFTQFTTVFSDT